MNSFGAYRDPRILPRHPHGCQPDRPDPNATTAALERRHPELVNIMVERSARYGDGRDANVYAWESHIWADAGLDDSPLLSPTQAQDFAARLWSRYAPRFGPYFSGVPEIRVLGEAEAVGGARAQALHHRVLVDQCHCSRPWLLHELLHLCVPSEQHGPTWASAMVTAWADEFGIDREHAMRSAREMGLRV